MKQEDFEHFKEPLDNRNKDFSQSKHLILSCFKMQLLYTSFSEYTCFSQLRNDNSLYIYSIFMILSDIVVLKELFLISIKIFDMSNLEKL